MTVFDTIAAECTAPYKSAVAMVRLSGKDAFSILSHLIKKKVEDIEDRKMTYVFLYQDKNDEKTLIDHGMIALFTHPHSYTGEDSVEFYLHGSRFIVEELMETLVHYGARRASGGEFSEKAFLNGKMDLTEAEAVNQLVNSRTRKSRDFALHSLNGNSSKIIKKMKEDLNLLTAEIEVDIDYPEYEENKDIVPKIREKIPPMLNKAERLLDSSRQSKYLFNGIKVAIVGEPNVGKSTLLNALLGEDKAIVTAIPGTTRDVVEGEKESEGLIWHFFDTAGIRNEAGEIEKLGIEKTFRTIGRSDIILLLIQKGQDIEKEIDRLQIRELIKNKPLIRISTKRDLDGNNDMTDLSLSKNDEDFSSLYALMKKKLDLDKESTEGFATERDLDLLKDFVDQLQSIIVDLDNDMTVDVMEVKLIEATHDLDEMLGTENTMEDIYNTVFSHFCVGK